MNKYLIVPGCCDLNRGDQALGWETKRIAEDSGFVGEYSILAEQGEPYTQSIDEGFNVLIPVLQHPTRILKKKNNINYTLFLKIKLGIVSLFDFLYSIFLLCPIIKYIFRFFSFGQKRKTLKYYKKCDAVFMKGGGLIQSHGGITSTYATYYRLYSIFLAHSFKKKVYIMPNSFGPFDGPFVKFIIKKAFKKCALITSREEKTTKYVKENIKYEINTFPDLAFYLKNAAISKEEFSSKYNLPKDKDWIAITARPYRFPNSKNPTYLYEKYISSLANFIDYVSEKGFIPILIEHTFATTEHENDRKALEDIMSKTKSNNFYFVSNPEYNCYQLKSIYSFCSYIIGTRFHSLIFSLSNKVPGIAISYDGNKSTGIMKDIGLDDYVIDIFEINFEKMKNMFENLIYNKDKVIEKIGLYLDYSEKMRNILIKNIKGA